MWLPPGTARLSAPKGPTYLPLALAQTMPGNTASDTQSGINIDKTAPVIAFVSRTPANSNGWNNGDVTAYLDMQ